MGANKAQYLGERGLFSDHTLTTTAVSFFFNSRLIKDLLFVFSRHMEDRNSLFIAANDKINKLFDKLASSEVKHILQGFVSLVKDQCL